jgi:hypothetical protein
MLEEIPRSGIWFLPLIKPLRRMRTLCSPAQTQVANQVWMNTTFISQGPQSWGKLAVETIWARQNLQLLTSSKSGWRALVQVMLPLVHAVLKWLEHSGRPAYMGGVSPVLYRLLYRHDLPKYLPPVQISAGTYIFTISWGKIKNLSRLVSVLSLHFKFVHNHKSCPNSAATLLSP